MVLFPFLQDDFASLGFFSILFYVFIIQFPEISYIDKACGFFTLYSDAAQSIYASPNLQAHSFYRLTTPEPRRPGYAFHF